MYEQLHQTSYQTRVESGIYFSCTVLLSPLGMSSCKLEAALFRFIIWPTCSPAAKLRQIVDE
jgi:hypothetical protein